MRQHISKSPSCSEVYDNAGLLLQMNSRNDRKATIDLHSSILHESSQPTNNQNRKRKATQNPLNIPAPKKVTISALSPTFLQEKFGAHALASNMLLKGQSFSAKQKFVHIHQWKAPQNKLMNDLFCNGGTYFNHFSKNAIVLDPKVEHLANPKLPFPSPPEVIFINSIDDISFVSSVASSVASVAEEENDEDGVESVESDNNVDGGSVRDEDEDDESNESTQRIANLNNNTNGQFGDFGDAEAVATIADFSDVQITGENTTPAIPNPPEGNGLVNSSLLQK